MEAHRSFSIVLVTLIAGIAGCALLALFSSLPGRTEAEVGSAASPFVLVVSSEHASKSTFQDRQSAEELLSKESGMTVRLRVASTGAEAVGAFESEADAGLMNVFDYLLARHEFGVEAGLQVLRRQGEGTYTGVILVQAKGPVKRLTDLRGRKVAFVAPHSDSGFVFPTKLLASVGVEVEAVFAGSHAAALEKLKGDEVAAAATYSGAQKDDPSLRVLATTEPIPNEPVFFRKGLDAGKRARVTEALVRFAQSDLGRRILPAFADITGFRPTTDSVYAGVKEAIKAAGKTVYDVVPGGWEVEAGRRERKDLVPW